MATRRVDRQTFLGYLARSELVSAAELEALLPRLPQTNRGRLVARSLVEMGVLTRFQAERLLAGRTAGFHLGQYRILDQIGKGGMGRVYKAEHRTMGRVVALKVLAPDLVESERAQQLFLREVRAAARLVHPNVVTAYDANQIDGRFFLVLEFVDGPNLDQLVKGRMAGSTLDRSAAPGRLSVGLACDYIRQVAAGLQAAHLLGMVHRDVKPANVLVQRRGLAENQPGLVKLSDFGLARLHHPDIDPDDPNAGTILTKDNAVMGTPDFLSPEQARSLHDLDIRSDVYSLGCTFYFLLTGEVPFPGGNALDKLIRHTTEPPLPLERYRDDLPAAVVAACEKMLEKSAERRYQTPAEVVAALEPYAVSGPIPWAPPPPPVLPADAPDPAEDSDDADRAVLDGSSPDVSSLASTMGPGATPTQSRPGLRLPERPRSLPWWWWAAVVAALAGLAALAAGLVRGLE